MKSWRLDRSAVFGLQLVCLLSVFSLFRVCGASSVQCPVCREDNGDTNTNSEVIIQFTIDGRYPFDHSGDSKAEHHLLSRSNSPPGDNSHPHQSKVLFIPRAKVAEITSADSMSDIVEGGQLDFFITAATDLKNDGNKLLLNHKYSLAADKYTAAIELHPSSIVYSNRAQALIKLESYGLAIQDANESIRIDPTYLKAYYRRGSANYALGKLKEALKDFKQVVKVKPKDEDAVKKMKTCEKEIKAEAFIKAIESEGGPVGATLLSQQDLEGMIVEAAYTGPRLGPKVDDSEPASEKSSGEVDLDSNLFRSSHITMNFVHELIAHFKVQKLLHRKFVLQILVAAREHFCKQPSLLRLTLPVLGDDLNIIDDPDSPGVVGHFTVCGDTHGQFYDLLNIFEKGGFPSETNPYLFNGDFVDRGSFSFETVFLLLTIKLACPTGLYMLRGNHETKNMNKIYGFEGEVHHKYDTSVMNHFAAVFKWLPLAAVLSNKQGPSPLSVFVVHGGLSTNIPAADVNEAGIGAITLEAIEGIPRGREPPESGLMADLLWSDPQSIKGRSPSKRGVGFSFGPDYTNAFLEKNNLQLVVRSHEVKDDGYVVEHEGKCITIFSAPNYCDQMGNKGAFIRFRENMKPNFTQFDSVPHPDIPPMRYAGNVFGL